jgi:hypothetical protein
LHPHHPNARQVTSLQPPRTFSCSRRASASLVRYNWKAIEAYITAFAVSLASFFIESHAKSSWRHAKFKTQQSTKCRPPSVSQWIDTIC